MPAFAVTALLLATGCSSSQHQTSADDRAQGTARVSDDTTGAARADGRALAVAAAPAATATTAAGSAGSNRPAHRTTLTVSSYDSKTRRAVISKAGSGGSSSPTASPAAPVSPVSPTASPGSPTVSPSPSAPASARQAAVGDVIASAPAPGAPDGLLAKVTKVIGETGEGTEVQTEPATLDALLGDDTAKGTVPVDPAAFDVDKLLPDVKVSWSKSGDVHVGPEGATVPLGSLRLDVSAEVPTAEGAPASAAASVSGFVQVAPQVDFAYGGEGTGSAPGSAYLGVSGDWNSGWAVKGRAAAATATPLRIPFAKLHADPVLQVGPVPVVVNLDLTCYLQISGDGRITVDVEQSLKGDFKAGGTFGTAQGWTPVSSSDMTSTPVRSSVTTAGSVKAGLGAEASVGLYGTVGVTADLAPYLRGEATGTVTATSATPGADAQGAWNLYGGVDLSGTLRLQLSVFGTPVLQRSIPLGALHREWKLAGGTL
ncbi:hypothetical protein EDD90_3150 [Streptomyces sp. Ag109_O5-1]|uniref:hypothetical protein n=1 Tax=Streptomyces sp. Ag109_O5-1 TaxID=1938851 RepID=UPI000F511CA7|nr:hypothetical protein [Streptomyces sp. Ag109_O5-1]RPE40120.1 hypothetical protein EDD90_3150 [Streptomyces sp. Ag109_O5-1]